MKAIKLTKTEVNALYKICVKNDLRPVMECVYYDGGQMVASDGHILMAVKAEYDAKNEGKIIHKDGRAIEGFYPRWQSVIPSERATRINVSQKKLFDAVKNIRKVKNAQFTIINICDYYFSAERIFKILNVLKKEKFDIYIHDLNYGGAIILFKNENVTALCMNMLIEKNYEFNKENIEQYNTPIIYTIDEALNYKHIEKTTFTDDAQILTGHIIGTIEVDGITYNAVATKDYVYAVFNNAAQTKIPYRFIPYAETMEVLKSEIEKLTGLKEKQFDLPKKLTETIYIDRLEGEMEAGTATLLEIHNIQGIEFKIFRYQRRYQMTYQNCSISNSDYLDFSGVCDRLKKHENLEEFLDSYINKSFKNVA